MRIILGIATALIALPAFAQSPTTPQATAAPQAGERTGTPAATQSGAAGSGPVVAAESGCLKRLQQSIPAVRRTLATADRQELRRLRDSAVILANRGREGACQTIVVEMERIATGNQAATNAPGQTGAQPKALATDARTRMTISMDDMLDSDIVGLGGEDLGEVNDVVIVHGPQVRAFAIVDRDEGWLHIGDELVAVPLGQVRSLEDGDYAVAITRKDFEKLATIDHGKLDDPVSYEGLERQWTAHAPVTK